MSTPEIAEAQWRTFALQHMREKELEWKQRGYRFAWIDPEPVYCTVSDWSMLFDKNYDMAFPDPTVPCDRILRFTLLGGGQIRVLERFRACRPLMEGLPSVWCPKIELMVTAHNGEGITVAVGEKYEGNYSELNAQAVVLTKGYQEVAERTAETFRLMDDDAEHFFALLDGTSGCAICGRALRDEISKLVGVGPECASQYRIPHNKEAAERRLTLRRKLLGQ